MAFLPCSSSLPPGKDDNREKQMVEGVPAKAEDRRAQGHRFTPHLWPRVWPLRTTAREAKRAHRRSLQDPRRPVLAVSARPRQTLQPPQRWHLRRLPPGVSLQRADVSQEHEGVTFRSIQGEEKSALEPPHTGERDRERAGGEGGRTVTLRRGTWSETALPRCLKRRIWAHEEASFPWGAPRGLLYVVMMVVMKVTRSLQLVAKYCRSNVMWYSCWWTCARGPQW